MEVAAERAGTQDVGDMQEVVLPSGVAYVEERVGGGQTPIKGYLVVVDYM
jgi:FKBP-type peptidyl-prolyl cis-trans isomerase